VRDCLAHPALRPALERLYAQEIIPALPVAGGSAYCETILDRFDNPFMEHKLEDIALNSVSKWRARLLPSAVDCAARTGRAPALIAFSLAALIHRYTTVAGLKDDARVLEAFARLAPLAAADPGGTARAALADPAIWGEPLPDLPGFREKVAASFQEIRSLGMLTALEWAVEEAE